MSDHLRVMGGRWRGRRLEAPRGNATRPASGRLRLSVMNILGTDVLEGARVLDLFAGTGAVGIEALSRGAASATFVERARPALLCLRKNLDALDLSPDEAAVLPVNVMVALQGETPPPLGPFDVVFCDPPYPLYDDPAALGRLRAGLGDFLRSGGAVPGAFLILEHPARGDPGPPPAGWRLLDRRAYSAAGVSLFRAGPPGLGSAT